MAQILPGLVSNVPELSTFFSLLQANKDLLEQVALGNCTVLAPVNDAFTSLNTSQLSNDQRDALLRYHILRGSHSSASLGDAAQLQSWLTDKRYTNVTSGQVVSTLSSPTRFVAGLWKETALVTPDIFFTGGFIHSIAQVLEIPAGVGQSTTGANLTSYIGLGAKLNLVTPADIPIVQGIQVWPNLTIFAPNSTEYSSNFTGWEGISAAERIRLSQYHIINGTVLYSRNMQNNQTYTTASGLNVTVYQANGSTYINDALISKPDLLVANGVMQILQRPLNPNATQARPDLLTTDSTSSTSLSRGAAAGIGVGVAIAVFALVALAWWLLRRRRNSRKSLEAGSSQRDTEEKLAPSEAYSPAESATPVSKAHELTTTTEVFEMNSPVKRHELAPPPPSELHGHTSRQELPG